MRESSRSKWGRGWEGWGVKGWRLKLCANGVGGGGKLALV